MTRAVALVVVAALAGCGTSGGDSSSTASAPPSSTESASASSTASAATSTQSASAVAASAPAPPELEAVVRAWSAALNANDNATAGALFVENAVIFAPAAQFRLANLDQATRFNDSLPCGGEIVDIRYADETVTVTFRLIERPAHRCDDPGGLAAAEFLILDGKIIAWRQILPPEDLRPAPPSSGSVPVA